ncbi:hypothetical protein MPSI1_002686 [Malassezia psittaci]|uniref:Uncharacterized protein n=1 Tax=Malassezia psittaci TaxID=1821823 RepID=A0AAF0FD42_9BASI|nr:hypothetical protein MPSI1_002686 [Malassezia psittaci]
MIYKSLFRQQKLPENLSIPQFVFRHLDGSKSEVPVLHPSPYRSRAQDKPLTLLDVRDGAYAIASSLLSSDYPGGPWKKGEVVLILAENQHDYLMVCLGIMLAGGIPALLNPQFTGEELVTMMMKVQMRAVFATNSTYQAAEDALKSYEKDAEKVQLYVFEEDHPRSLHRLLKDPKMGNTFDDSQIPCKPMEDIGVYCFSSGTSGLPKVVGLSHYNVVSNVIQTVATLGGRMNKPRFDDADWYNQPLLPPQNGHEEFHISILPQFHCYGLLMAIAALHTATPCVVFARFNVERFFETVQKYHITFMFVVPPMLMAIATSPLADKYDLSSIKSFASGAASLSDELCELVYDKKKIPVTNGYGMTEMSPLIALQTPQDLKRNRHNVGRLVPNTEVRIVDIESGEDVEPGKSGELLLRGPQMMLGYIANDKANREAFTPNAHDLHRFFKSGDVGSIDEEGFITVHERIKDIIKYNGYQVSACELEDIVRSSRMVQEVAVVGKLQKDNISKNELPWAFVTLNQQSDDKSEEQRTEALLKSVNDRVPPYKKLRGVTWVDQLPKKYVG